MIFSRRYSLNHCRHILQKAYSTYLKEGKPPVLKEKLMALQDAIDAGNKDLSNQLAHELEKETKVTYKKSWFASALELAGALAFALVIATIIRSMWFEPYEIPTGSMRPTFKEQDHLTVSKAQFGINVPLETAHFYFDPQLVQRTSAIIFSGDGIPLPDTDSTFLGIFPYKKRYVKRMIGKPEDTFYFYGGKLYAWDKEGNKVQELLDAPWMEKLDHIPFISFEGQPQQIDPNTIVLSYFNQPLGKITRNPLGILEGSLKTSDGWVSDDITAAKTPHEKVKTLGDFFGLNNYAMAQIYTKEELASDGLKPEGEGVLYLVLRHTPNLDFSKGAKQAGRLPKTMTTVIPLQPEDLKTLQNSMYTARFVVEKGKGKRYSLESRAPGPNAPQLADVPDGTYEFYYGKGYEVHFGGITSELPKDHPLYALNPTLIQQLFNLGNNWDNGFQPKGKARGLPTRYAYFRDGDFYVMGQPFLKKEDPRLKAYVNAEQKRQEASNSSDPYIAFIDRGAPTNKSSFGLKIPPQSYLVLGDNHAMSADSRVFGFVPEANLQGVPDLILWPPGDGRLGPPAQKPYPTFVAPRLIVWSIAAICGLIAYAIWQYRLRKRLTF